MGDPSPFKIIFSWFLALKHKGTFTLIYRADRLHIILASFNSLSKKFGDIGVFPLWTRLIVDGEGSGLAKRVIIRARKGVDSPLRLFSGLVMHQENGCYMEEAEEVLRGGKKIIL